MRDTVLIYRTHIDALRNLPGDQFKAAMLAIADYAMDGKLPDGDPIAMAMLMMAKPILDKNNRNYENGKRGGRPNRTETRPEPTGNRTETEPKPEDNRQETEQEPSRNPNDKCKRINVNNNKKDILSGKPDSVYPYAEIIDYLNAKTGKRFDSKTKDTRRHIKARIDEGKTLDDFKKVIDNMCAKWKGDPKMDDYLRPSTLFGTKFESYLNVRPVEKKPQSTGFSNFPQREYDWSNLERMITG